jgi:hypothetical protein
MLEKRMEDNAPVSWDAKRAALEEAFRKLPIQHSKAMTGIPYESLLPDIPRQLMLMAHIPRSEAEFYAAKNNLRNKNGLHKLAKKIGDVIKVLDGLSRDALDSLNYRQTALSELKTKLRIFHEVTKAAKFHAPRRQPPKVQARKLARVVGQHYYGLTGRIPAKTVDSISGNARGQFIDLLRTVYKILGIKASAEAQATALNKEWRAAKALVKKTGKPLQFLIGKN